MSSQQKKQILILSGFFIASVILWNNIIIYPIKLFVVMLHEMSHCLTAVLLGGQIQEIQIDHRIGGYCRTISPQTFFTHFFIASAGYLGSLIWGGLILIVAFKTEYDRYVSLAIGIVAAILSVYVIKTGELFGILFSFGFSFMMIVSYKFLSNTFHDYMLKFLGLTSCMYTVIDIKSDLIDRTGIGSDADAIAALTGIPSILVGLAWMLIALAMVFYIFKIAFRQRPI
jgi:hypothetical protein